MGGVFSLINLALLPGAVSSSPLAGFVYETTQSYSYAIWPGAALLFISGVCLCFVEKENAAAVVRRLSRRGLKGFLRSPFQQRGGNNASATTTTTIPAVNGDEADGGANGGGEDYSNGKVIEGDESNGTHTSISSGVKGGESPTTGGRDDDHSNGVDGGEDEDAMASENPMFDYAKYSGRNVEVGGEGGAVMVTSSTRGGTHANA